MKFERIYSRFRACRGTRPAVALAFLACTQLLHRASCAALAEPAKLTKHREAGNDATDESEHRSATLAERDVSVLESKATPMRCTKAALTQVQELDANSYTLISTLNGALAILAPCIGAAKCYCGF